MIFYTHNLITKLKQSYKNVARDSVFLSFVSALILFSASCSDKATLLAPSGALKANPSSIQFASDLPVDVESPVKKIYDNKHGNVGC